jgi:hypothetical protein
MFLKMSAQASTAIGDHGLWRVVVVWGLGTHCHGNGVERAAYRVGCRDGSALVPPSSLPAGDHPARDLAVSPLHLSYRDVEELLAERGLDVSYETVRRWVLKFGPLMAGKLRQGRPRHCQLNLR